MGRFRGLRTVKNSGQPKTALTLTYEKFHGFAIVPHMTPDVAIDRAGGMS